MLKDNKTMKRYLYILLGALLFTSCELLVEMTSTAKIELGNTTAECHDNSATITTDIPKVTINGTAYTNYTISLKYIDKANEESGEYVTSDEYYVINNKVTFNIENLEPNTKYIAYITVDAGTYGSDFTSVTFTTKSSMPTCNIECDTEVEAAGVKATITLENVAYKADGKSKSIANVRIEYSKANSNKWVAVDIDDYNMAITIPENGESYLTENTNYIYRVSITPEDSTLSTLTTQEMEFKTKYAVVTADIDTPKLSIKNNTLGVVIENMRAYFDGESVPNYSNIKYGFQHRVSGEDEWSELITAEPKNNALSFNMSLNMFEKETTYEFRGVIIAGTKNKECYSEVASITIPKDDEGGNDDGGNDDGGNDDGGNDDGGNDDGGNDDGGNDDGGNDEGGNDDKPVTPPTPPITGDADTTALAGYWHLTSWRGSKPSFDVYLSITEDGVVSLFQRIESRNWETFYSTVGYEDGIIGGQYTDGVAWSTSYYVTIDGDTMVWTDTTDSTDVSVYTRCTLPDFTNPETRSATTSSKRFL